MAYPRYRASRAHKHFVRTAGNLTLNSTSWADLPTIGTTWDAVLPAQVGDTIEAFVSATWGNETTSSFLDFATVVGGVVTNYFATGGGAAGQGVNGLVGEGAVFTYTGGSSWKTLVAGDLSAGTVTVRLRYRTTSATNKILFANTDISLMMMVKNLGPADPN